MWLCSSACATASNGCVSCASHYFGANGAFALAETVGAVRVVDGTIIKEPGKTGSLRRILYSLQLPSLVCDFLEVTASGGEGNGESLNRLPVARHELILADAGYCSIAGIEYVRQRGVDVLVRVNPQAFVAYSQQGRRFNLPTQLRQLPKHDDRSSRAWLHGKLLVALLAQKLIGIGRDISPYGCLPMVATASESVA